MSGASFKLRSEFALGFDCPDRDWSAHIRARNLDGVVTISVRIGTRIPARNAELGDPADSYQ